MRCYCYQLFLLPPTASDDDDDDEDEDEFVTPSSTPPTQEEMKENLVNLCETLPTEEVKEKFYDRYHSSSCFFPFMMGQDGEYLRA